MNDSWDAIFRPLQYVQDFVQIHIVAEGFVFSPPKVTIIVKNSDDKGRKCNLIPVICLYIPGRFRLFDPKFLPERIEGRRKKDVMAGQGSTNDQVWKFRV